MRYSYFQKKHGIHDIHFPENCDFCLRLKFTKIIFVQDVPIILLVFVEASWYNKMSKYGLPRFRKSRKHQSVKF